MVEGCIWHRWRWTPIWSNSFLSSPNKASYEISWKDKSSTLEPFRFEDLMWTPHVLSRKGRYNTYYYVVIQWKKLDDFVVGEQTNEVFLCKFTKDIIHQNLLNSKSNPQANSVAIAIKQHLYVWYSYSKLIHVLFHPCIAMSHIVQNKQKLITFITFYM